MTASKHLKVAYFVQLRVGMTKSVLFKYGPPQIKCVFCHFSQIVHFYVTKVGGSTNAISTFRHVDVHSCSPGGSL